ncbi:TPA: beta-hexosaminidase, partial [Enterococcus faecium]|nr:beta-hexosaminidase [Enterococcus faecium]
MTIKVDLRKKPYNLDEDAISWIEETIDSMTLEEKIGQLFVNMGSSRDKNYLSNMVNQYHIGAVRYNPGTADE